MRPELKEPEPEQPTPVATPAVPAVRAAAQRPDRALLAILASIAVLVAVALLAVFTRGEPAALDGGTPAGVVQRYSAAVIAGDESAATAYLSDSARNTCGNMERMALDNLRITLVSTTERAESADVKVLLTFSGDGGPFGNAGYQVEDAFDLVRTGGTWRIDRAPWQLTVCPNPAVRQ
ncbi:hypothetical protein [Arthrobacter sp. CG_A4]|uniref:hypothetical protein n=1 Tax=Arthrobacter sp. CG_A4 TaxID=3071706 RepID=UPI002E086BED|nr:hypothetical protein [Arthrobacter sp. CG_A4]